MSDLLTYGDIVLRALEPEDLELLYTWENEVSLWSSGNTYSPFSRYKLKQYIDEASLDIYARKQERLIITVKSGTAVGAVDLFDFDPYHQRAQVGIMIHNEEDRRHGYAADALVALENYAVNILGIRQLYASISEANQPSLQLFEKSGYQVTGIKKSWLRTSRGWENEWFMQKMLV